MTANCRPGCASGWHNVPPLLLAFFRDVLSGPAADRSTRELKRSAGILERDLREELTVGDVPRVRQRLWRLRERGWTVALRSVGGWDEGLAAAAIEALDALLDAPHVSAPDLSITATRGTLGRRLSLAVSGSTSAAVGDALPPGWDITHAATQMHAVMRLTGPVVEIDDWT